MKPHFLRHTTFALFAFLLLADLPQAMSESGPLPDAKALLNEAKKNQAERERAAMQRDLDRFAEEVNKGQQEIAELAKSMSAASNAMAGTRDYLDQLAGRKRRILQDLELMPLRIDAEKLKAESLELLNTAHAKETEALTRRNEELELKRALVSAEMQTKLEPVAASESDAKKGKSESAPTITELRRNLQKAESRTVLANEKAREALNLATQKFQHADAAAAKVEKKQADIELENSPKAPDGGEPPKAKSKRGR